jgi:hypothetical protein
MSKEAHKLRIFQNGALRGTFGSEREAGEICAVSFIIYAPRQYVWSDSRRGSGLEAGFIDHF